MAATLLSAALVSVSDPCSIYGVGNSCKGEEVPVIASLSATFSLYVNAVKLALQPVDNALGAYYMPIVASFAFMSPKRAGYIALIGAFAH